MARKKRLEKELYPDIKEWLEKKGYFTKSGYTDSKGDSVNYIDIGIKGAGGRIDVVGIKNIGTEYVDNIEIVGVEAKVGDLKIQHIGQALAYSVFTHKMYLAYYEGECTELLKKIIDRLGFGLLEIKKRKKGYEIIEKLSPSLKHPDEDLMSLLLNKLNYVKCTICGCYVPINVYHKADPKRHRGRPARELEYPNWLELDIDDEDIQLRKEFDIRDFAKENKEYIVKRYICRVCEQYFKSQVRQQVPRR